MTTWPPSASACSVGSAIVASASSVYSATFPISNAHDGNTATMAATGSAQTTDQWISFQMPANTAVGVVAVYNRNAGDGAYLLGMLNQFEVWLGATAGAQTYSCSGGGVSVSTAATQGPYLVDCGGRADLPYVTLLIRADGSTWKLLSINEMIVHGAQYSVKYLRKLG